MAVAWWPGPALVPLVKNALERVFVLGSKRADIRHFLLGFFARVGAADSFPLIVDAKHLRNGFVVGHPKETFQHSNDELHWSMVVIQQRYIAAREVGHLCDLTLRLPRTGDANGTARCDLHHLPEKVSSGALPK